MENKRVSFHTLGCKLNFSETSTIARMFEEGGFVRVSPHDSADICVINTCSVTEHADKKCRNLIRRLIKDNPGAIIAVTGCYAQLRPQAISAIEGVDLVIGNDSKGELFEKVVALSGKTGAEIYGCSADELNNFFASFSSNDRTRAFLKVQDGCDYRCSYCTIPDARGHSRNIPIAQIVNSAQQIAEAGQKEIVITGINTGDFGRATGEPFIDLLKELEKVEGIERYRISSIEPNLLTEKIVSFTALSKKFQPHFHIPLQSGCDRILALMRRRYNTKLFAEKIGMVRSYIPDAFIGIDLITGFPSETEEEFLATIEFLRSLNPAFLHIFPYSERPGTPAVNIPGKVHPQEAARRVKILTGLSDSFHRQFASHFTGTQARVLFESTRRNGLISGYTENYIKVNTPYRKELVNTICCVELTEPDEKAEMGCRLLQ